jgi:quercetin dioxygenase-like cupin family protein
VTRNKVPVLRLLAAIVLGSFCGATSAADPDPGVVQRLLTEPVANKPDQELEVLTVEYPPGGSSAPHRHDAFVVVYVLHGALEMQVRGQALTTVHQGETFVERPEDIHQVSRNASATESVKFLVVALKSAGKPLSRGVPPQ